MDKCTIYSTCINLLNDKINTGLLTGSVSTNQLIEDMKFLTTLVKLRYN